MKIAFFGTGEFSKNILKDLIENYSDKIDIKLAVSQPDKEVGRKKVLEETAVKKMAKKHNIKVLQPNKLKNNIEFFNELNFLNLDFIIVVAYGKIVPKEVLNAPKRGCINIHGSILPQYRGASPIQESVKNGDKKTGLTIMYMTEGMDTGDILKTQEINIDILDKTGDIFQKFEKIGANLLINTLEGIIDNSIKGTKQNNTKATYCSKISKEDGKVNFSKEKSTDIFNKYKSYYSWPGIYSYFNGKKLNFEEIELKNYTGNKKIGEVEKIDKKNVGIVGNNNKIIILKQVKLEGKKSMDILSFINGNKDFLDYKF